MDVSSKFEKEIIDKLKESGLIEKFSINEIEQTPDIILINKLFTHPQGIFSDSNGLYYVDQNGVKNYCPHMHVSISKSGDWLSILTLI